MLITITVWHLPDLLPFWSADARLARCVYCPHQNWTCADVTNQHDLKLTYSPSMSILQASYKVDKPINETMILVCVYPYACVHVYTCASAKKPIPNVPQIGHGVCCHVTQASRHELLVWVHRVRCAYDTKSSWLVVRIATVLSHRKICLVLTVEKFLGIFQSTWLIGNRYEKKSRQKYANMTFCRKEIRNSNGDVWTILFIPKLNNIFPVISSFSA